MPNQTKNERRRTLARRRRGKYGNPHDADLVRRARELLELSQDQLGVALGQTQGSISHVEQQARPLSLLARREIERLIAARHAAAAVAAWCVEPVAVALHCDWRDGSAADYILHMGSCAKCLAHAALNRRRDPLRDARG